MEEQIKRFRQPRVGKKAGVLVKKVNLSIEKKSYGVREAIRTLRTNLQFCGDDRIIHTPIHNVWRGTR